jgi:hypothetical protein
MNQNKNAFVVALVAVVIAITALGVALVKPDDKVGASGTRSPNGVSADVTSPVPGELRGDDLTLDDDATISGGLLEVTTSNTATSTTKVGCIQTTATSTASPWRLRISATGATSTFNGSVYAEYGNCP